MLQRSNLPAMSIVFPYEGSRGSAVGFCLRAQSILCSIMHTSCSCASHGNGFLARARFAGEWLIREDRASCLRKRRPMAVLMSRI